MNFKINNLDSNQVEIEIKVSKEEFSKSLDSAFKKNASKYNVPGFRKGKVPFQVFKKMFGIEVLYNDAANDLIDKTYIKVIKENNIDVVDYPSIEIVNCNENEDFEYKAKVYVKPEVKLGNYRGIEVKGNIYEVKSEDIEKELDIMRNKGVRITAKENAVIEDGDIAVIDFKGYIDDVAFQGGEGKNYNLHIGSKTFIDNFEEQLISKSKGDEVVVNVTFPQEYNVEDLKGKPAKFEVVVNDVMKRQLPELNDDFAKDYSEFQTLEELKSSIKEKLEESNKNKEKYEFENSVIETVCKNAEVLIPAPMVENEISRLLKDFEGKLKNQGMDLTKYCQYYGITIEDIRNNFKDRAEKQVLSDVVLEAVSLEEKIEVSDTELNEKVEELAKNYSQDENQIEVIKNNLLTSYKDSLKRDIVLTKTIEFLVKEAKKV